MNTSQLWKRRFRQKLLMPDRVSYAARVDLREELSFGCCYNRQQPGKSMSPPSSQITELLRAWSTGDQSAVGKVVELAYPELYRIARRHIFHERPGHTIQATALVNEAYLRLVNVRNVQWKDRAHFLAVGAQIMRRILVDYARARPGAARVDLSEQLAITPELDLNFVLLDRALESLAGFDARKAKVVEMRFFGGLTAQEIAAVLGISIQSVHREWSLAKAWLVHEMKREGKHGSGTVGAD